MNMFSKALNAHSLSSSHSIVAKFATICAYSGVSSVGTSRFAASISNAGRRSVVGGVVSGSE